MSAPPDAPDASDPPDYDGAWKNALDAYFADFMRLFWPELHAHVDWTREVVFLDKELQRLDVSRKPGRLNVDKLARVQLRSGNAMLTLIHVEIQGDTKNPVDLPARMYGYHVRLREKYPQHPLASLAVLTQRRQGPATQTYSYDHWGCAVTFSFPAFYLERWRAHVPELLRLAPANPFAVVVLAQLEVNARHPNDQQFARKKDLVRRLYDWGFSHEQIIALFNILDAMLVLPTSMEQPFVQAVSQIEEEHKMTYVNTIERVALRRGREEGRLEGKQEGRQEGTAEVLAALIARKFGDLPDWAQTRLAAADKPTLNRWAMQILDAQCLEDVFI